MTRLFPPALVAFAVVLGFAAAARAQPAPTTASCQPSQSSLILVGCSLVQQLALPAGVAAVTVVDLKSDRELPAPDALRGRIQNAVTLALGAPNAGTKERGRLRVELTVEKKGGLLRVTAEARRATGLWQRIRHAKPSAERRGFVEVPLDAELRALIPPPPLVVSEVLKLKAPERGIAALACGPLGNDGGQELVLVSRSSVRVGRVVGRAFAERKRVAWSTLSAVAPTPLREPIASAEITAQGNLRVGLTDRKDGLELSPELGVLARFEGLMPVAGSCVMRSALGLSARFQSCAEPAASRGQPATLDAVAGFAELQLGRDVTSTRVIGARPELAQLTPHVGAQLAAGDPDSDGDAELAYSSDTLDAAKDRLTLVTLKDKQPVHRFELAAPGITAIAVCRGREGPGMAPIIVASGDQLWLIR